MYLRLEGKPNAKLPILVKRFVEGCLGSPDYALRGLGPETLRKPVGRSYCLRSAERIASRARCRASSTRHRALLCTSGKRPFARGTFYVPCSRLEIDLNQKCENMNRGDLVCRVLALYCSSRANGHEQTVFKNVLTHDRRVLLFYCSTVLSSLTGAQCRGS